MEKSKKKLTFVKKSKVLNDENLPLRKDGEVDRRAYNKLPPKQNEILEKINEAKKQIAETEDVNESDEEEIDVIEEEEIVSAQPVLQQPLPPIQESSDEEDDEPLKIVEKYMTKKKPKYADKFKALKDTIDNIHKDNSELRSNLERQNQINKLHHMSSKLLNNMKLKF